MSATAATEAPRRPAAPGSVPGRPPEEEQEPRPEDPEVPEEEQPEEEEEEDGEPKPPDLNALLEKADPAVLRKHPRIAGIIGEQAKRDATREAQRLAEQMVKDREERWRAERSREELLAKARTGEYYALGETAAKDLLNQEQQRAVDGFSRQAEAKTYEKMQAVLDDWATGQPEEVNVAAAERMGEVPQGSSWEDGFRKWLDAYVVVRSEHLAAQPEAKQRAERDLTPAVRARVLADMNGTEPTADSGSGRPKRSRTITDDDIARMDLDEYMTVWDVEKGRPKPGVTYKPTRAVDPRVMQVGGRSF